MTTSPDDKPKMHPVTAVISLISAAVMIYFAIQLFIA